MPGRGAISPRPAWYRRYEALILGTAGVLVTLLAWEAVVRFGFVRPVLLSSPTAVVEAGWREISSGNLWTHLRATGTVWVIGLVLGCVAGAVVGTLAGWFRPVRTVANPWLNVLDSVPMLALVPIFIIWLGIGPTFKIVLVFLSVYFYVAVNTIAGVMATESRFLDVGKSFGASQLTVFRTIVIPGSIPYIITGFRQGASRGLVTTIAAEFISSEAGIGFMIAVAGATINTARAMFGLVLLAALGIVIGQVLGRIEHRFDAWRST